MSDVDGRAQFDAMQHGWTRCALRKRRRVHLSRVLTGGMKLTLPASVSIPVNTRRPVFGHLIITMAMVASPKAAPLSDGKSITYGCGDRFRDRRDASSLTCCRSWRER